MIMIIVTVTALTILNWVEDNCSPSSFEHKRGNGTWLEGLWTEREERTQSVGEQVGKTTANMIVIAVVIVAVIVMVMLIVVAITVLLLDPFLFCFLAKAAVHHFAWLDVTRLHRSFWTLVESSSMASDLRVFEQELATQGFQRLRVSKPFV